MRYSIFAILSAGMLVACGGGDPAQEADATADKIMQQASKDALETLYEDPASNPASVLPARTETLGPPADLSPVTETTDTLNFKTEFPAALNDFAPELAATLVEDAKAELDQARIFAQEDKDEGGEYFRAHEYETIWSITARSGDLISLQSLAYMDTGGAHPNSYQQGLIYNASAQAQLSPMDLFTSPEVAYAVLQPLLAETLTDEKLERFDQPMDDGGVIYAEVTERLPPLEQGFQNASLMASTEDGKLGGLLFNFPAYEIGAYAEGPYFAEIPQADFNAALKPEYKALFAGDPVSLPDQ